MSFQDSQTFHNLQTAYEDELRASARYRLYAARAEEDGQVGVASRFDAISRYAMCHACICLKKINGDAHPGTLQNLREAARGKFSEWTRQYAAYAQTAQEEGFADLAELFDRLAGISRYHNVCFCRLADAMEEDFISLREYKAVWLCLSCGYAVTGKGPPDACPVCGKGPGWFEEMACAEEP